MSAAPPPPPPPPPILLGRSEQETSRELGPELNELPPIDEGVRTELLVLHRASVERAGLLDEANELLEAEWKFSHRPMLERSCDTLPISLVLLDCREGRLVGHAAVFGVVGRPAAVYLGSVVVARSERGRGFGRRLMHCVEEFCRAQLGRTAIYLETLNRPGFYLRLGYARAQSESDIVTPIKFKAQEDFALRFASSANSTPLALTARTWFHKNLS